MDGACAVGDMAFAKMDVCTLQYDHEYKTESYCSDDHAEFRRHVTVCDRECIMANLEEF